ncbi:uncharacterized protein LOC124315049 isoform X2 [Daphnia pulicaria]|uniref:uncharacterized protein LOC124315049 isoform X2 n=1 Tax=Daphnia pulicaria TaxID=35523 RepID=UPI001EEC6F09|nr:uncharacterized protein LOC124315049 isoform X2 [Daphnia pulicaria]
MSLSSKFSVLLLMWGFLLIGIVEIESHNTSNKQNGKYKSFVKNSNGLATRFSQAVVSQHEELISSKFDTAEYKPSMEILAVGLKYNNETAMLSVSVYVGVPEISSSDISNNSTMSELESTSASTHSPSSETVEKFTNYEIYLSALSIDDSSEPPSSCLNFLFLQHSSQNVVVGCNETEKVLPKYIDESPTTCVDVDTRNFTVVFNHVYSAYYCLLIQPQVSSHTRRTFNRMLHYQTSKSSTFADITRWQTTIDLFPVPKKQSISIAFTLPDSTYQIISNKIRVSLMRVTSDRCNDTNTIKGVWSEILPMEPGKQVAEITFSHKPPGSYCVAVDPLDERCNGNTFWKVKGASCRRHTIKSVELQGPPMHLETGGINKPLVIVNKTPAMDVWVTFYVVCAFAFGLVLVSFLGILLGYRYRQRKHLQRRTHQFLAEWGTSTEVSPTQSSIADVISVKKMLDEKDSTTSDDLIPGTPASSETSSVGVSVLLLYRRNDPQVSVRAADLRKRLQLDCGNQIKVYDYGDESQWEEMFTEGPSWLPNRIYGTSDEGCLNRVVVIHSPLHPDFREKRPESDRNNLESSSPLLGELTADQLEQHKNDPEFLYGMQLLQSCTREVNDNCENTDHAISLYRRVFNVRYTDIADCQSPETENQNLAYPDLTIAPFTCYLLPGHYKQLLEHLTSTQ